MGKIVKYCSSCEEGFAEKFAFCPDCGAPLQAFEMNPLTGEAKLDEEVNEAAPAAPVFLNETVAEEKSLPVTEDLHAADIEFQTEDAEAEAAFEEEEADADFEVNEPEYVTAETAGIGSYARADYANTFLSGSDEYHYTPDDGFHVTVIEEKNSGQRNGLLLGASVVMIVVMLSATVYSLFSKDLGVSAIDQGELFAWVPEINEAPVEVEEEKKLDKDDGGGGGGGGRDEQDPASKGQLPRMMDKPDLAPDVRMDRLTNPTLTQRVGVQGPQIEKAMTNERYGIDTSRFEGLSNGPGTGGGIGTGTGRGVGSGRDSGIGSGSGGGLGSGTGGGIGDGSGLGTGAPPPKPPVGVTSKVKIIAKPRPGYTDPARQNNVQGTVSLRVTFLASGQVGSITPVQRLPHGLTEQAIAAARQIRFEPAKRNGVPVATTMTVLYSFTIY